MNIDDKPFVMRLLKQAATRKLTNQALDVMMRTTPRGAAVDWLMVRERLENFIANASRDAPAAPPPAPSKSTRAGSCST